MRKIDRKYRDKKYKEWLEAQRKNEIYRKGMKKLRELRDKGYDVEAEEALKILYLIIEENCKVYGIGYDRVWVMDSDRIPVFWVEKDPWAEIIGEVLPRIH